MASLHYLLQEHRHMHHKKSEQVRVGWVLMATKNSTFRQYKNVYSWRSETGKLIANSTVQQICMIEVYWLYMVYGQETAHFSTTKNFPKINSSEFIEYNFATPVFENGYNFVKFTKFFTISIEK